MYKKQNILAVVLARSKSKSIKDKNIKNIKKIPLIGHAGLILKQIKLIDAKIISALSGSRVSDYSVLKHALILSEKIYKKKFDIIVSIPPTSPLRKKSNIIDCIKKLVNQKYDSVWTVSKTDSKFHPIKQLEIKKNKITFYDKIKGPGLIARQQLTELYHRNGCAYVISRKCILDKNTIITNNTGYIVLKGKQISIDTMYDFKEAEKFLS